MPTSYPSFSSTSDSSDDATDFPTDYPTDFPTSGPTTLPSNEPSIPPTTASVESTDIPSIAPTLMLPTSDVTEVVTEVIVELTEESADSDDGDVVIVTPSPITSGAESVTGGGEEAQSTMTLKVDTDAAGANVQSMFSSGTNLSVMFASGASMVVICCCLFSICFLYGRARRNRNRYVPDKTRDRANTSINHVNYGEGMWSAKSLPGLKMRGLSSLKTLPSIVTTVVQQSTNVSNVSNCPSDSDDEKVGTLRQIELHKMSTIHSPAISAVSPSTGSIMVDNTISVIHDIEIDDIQNIGTKQNSDARSDPHTTPGMIENFLNYGKQKKKEIPKEETDDESSSSEEVVHRIEMPDGRNRVSHDMYAISRDLTMDMEEENTTYIELPGQRTRGPAPSDSSGTHGYGHRNSRGFSHITGVGQVHLDDEVINSQSSKQDSEGNQTTKHWTRHNWGRMVPHHDAKGDDNELLIVMDANQSTELHRAPVHDMSEMTSSDEDNI